MDQDDSRLQVIQLTDCHLFADPSIELRGMFTWPRFQAVLKDIRHQFAGADLLVLTGDTAHDELQATYEVVRGELGPWCDRLRIIPGNHDNRSAITRVFPEACSVSGDRVTFDMRWKNWQLIGLDSQLPGEVAGSLEAEQLQWLDARLRQSPETQTLLFLHHPPISTDSPWLDKLLLRDAAELAGVLAAHPQVRLMGCGHVHQEVWGALAHATLFTTPAVGPPFRIRTEQLEIEPRAPSYRLLELHADGRWRTQVIPVTG
jgi:3',5'-cyclic-AMP phosphodiesterase